MKSTVLLYQCFTWCLLQMGLCVATNHAVNFINVSPGTTFIMEYNYTDTTADWNGPDHENKDIQIVQKDMYGKERTWNVTSYASKGHINQELPNAARLRIVGDEKGQYLQIENISLYDAGLYRCDIMMNDSVIFEFFILQIKQSIELDITYKPYGTVKEGQSLNMCCHSNSTVSYQTLRWFNEQLGLKEPHKSSEACLFFKNVSRNDSGIYTCIAKCNGQIGTKEITLSISYSPDVTFVNENYTETDKYRSIQCNANGFPMNYTYKQWEHKSFFDKHIRYLDGNATGYLNLPTQESPFRYQDSGVYECSVSNGVPDKSGRLFQTNRVYIISEGIPIFVEENKHKLYVNEGHQFDLKVNVLSFPNITCQHISPKGGMQMQLLVIINRVKIWTNFYGINIQMLGWEILFRFSNLNENDFKEYVISVCNEFGNTSYTIKLLPEDMESKVTVSKSLIGVIISSIIFTLIIVLMTKCVVEMRKRNADFTPEDSSETVEGQSEAIENVLYQSRRTENHNNLEISPASTLLPNDADSEHTISEHGTMAYNNEETGHVLEGHLNYADVVFQPSSSQDEVRIIGLEDRTVYADVDTAGFVRRVSDIQTDTSSSEDDFVYVQGIENYIEKRETND